MVILKVIKKIYVKDKRKYYIIIKSISYGHLCSYQYLQKLKATYHKKNL